MFKRLINVIRSLLQYISYKKKDSNYDRVRKWISSMNSRFPIVHVPKYGIVEYQILDNGNKDTSRISEWYLSDSLFSIEEHLYTWIDTVLQEINQPLKAVYLVPPEITEIFVQENFTGAFKNYLETQEKRILIIALGTDEEAKRVQIVNTIGFEAIIEEAFNKNHIVEQPIDNS